MTLTKDPNTPREPCPHCGTMIGLSTFQLDIKGRPTRAAFNRHARRCESEPEAERAYFREHGNWRAKDRRKQRVRIKR